MPEASRSVNPCEHLDRDGHLLARYVSPFWACGGIAGALVAQDDTRLHLLGCVFALASQPALIWLTRRQKGAPA